MTIHEPVDVEPLEDFEGLDVTEAGIEVRGIEGGLRDAVKIRPQTFRKGERVILVLDCHVDSVRLDNVEKDEPEGEQRRVHILKVKTVAPVDVAVVGDIIAAQAERIRKAKDDASGQGNLLDAPTDEGPGMLADVGDVGDVPDPLEAAVEKDEIAAKRRSRAK